MRDWLAHAYFGIDADILWDVAQNKVSELEQALNTFLTTHPEEGSAAPSQTSPT